MTAESLLQNNKIDPDKRTVQECCFPFYKYREKTIPAAGTKKKPLRFRQERLLN